jgi:hypothetical protein
MDASYINSEAEFVIWELSKRLGCGKIDENTVNTGRAATWKSL